MFRSRGRSIAPDIGWILVADGDVRRDQRHGGGHRDHHDRAQTTLAGNGLNRIPLFVWTQLITAFMIIFAMPAITLCSTILSMDRLTHLKTHFYNPAEGGDALLWQHLFWFFATWSIYRLIPATGFVSEMSLRFRAARLWIHRPCTFHPGDGVYRVWRVGASQCSPRRRRESDRGCLPPQA